MEAKFKRPMSTKRRPVFKTKQYGNPNKSNNCSRSVNNTTKKRAFTNQTLQSNNRQLASSLNAYKLSVTKLTERINELNGENLELRRELVEAKKRISTESSCSCNANLEVEHQKRLVEFLKPLKACLHAAVDCIQPLSENLGIALNITSAPERRSKSLGAINFREDRLQMKRQTSNHDGKTNNVSGNDGIPSKQQTDRSDIEQSNATLQISSHDDLDVHVTRRRPSKDLPNTCLSNSDLGFDFPTDSTSDLTTVSSDSHQQNIQNDIPPAKKKRVSNCKSSPDMQLNLSPINHSVSLCDYGGDTPGFAANLSIEMGQSQTNASVGELQNTLAVPSIASSPLDLQYGVELSRNDQTIPCNERTTSEGPSDSRHNISLNKRLLEALDEKSRSSKYGKNEENTKSKEQKINQNPSSETPAGLIRPRRIASSSLSYAENSPISPNVSGRPKRKARSSKSYKEPLLTKKLRQNKRDIK